MNPKSKHKDSRPPPAKLAEVPRARKTVPARCTRTSLVLMTSKSPTNPAATGADNKPNKRNYKDYAKNKAMDDGRTPPTLRHEC